MDGIKNVNKFLNYLGKKMDTDEMYEIYTNELIIYEKCELYKDFIITLMNLVFDTYMGDSVTDKKQRLEHFKWCWDKTINNFKLEGITFVYSDKLYQYFLNFMLDVFYLNSKDNEYIENNVIEMWDYMMGYDTQKTQSDLDVLVEVYQMFEESLKTIDKSNQ